MAASRRGSDDGRSSTIIDRSPSPLSTSQASTDAHFSHSVFVPLPRLESVDNSSDVHMTDDATDGTADASAATIVTGMATARERFSSPMSTSTTATSGRKVGRGGGGGGAAAATSAAAGVARRGGTASKTPSFRGGSSNGRGVPATRGGRSSSSSVAKPKPKAISANQGRFANSSARSSASPSVRRGGRGDTDDDGDNEDSDDDDGEDDGEDGDDDDNDDDVDSDDDSTVRATRKHPRNGGEPNTSDNGPYCICRGPDDHRWMIQCDDCEDWYHGDCVNVDKDDGETMIRSYICPLCTIPGRYETWYKKRCAYPNCRKAARLYSSNNSGAGGTTPAPAEHANHFCSDLHRDQWWDALLGRMGRARPVEAAAEAKLAVDQLTPAQLITVLLHTDEPGVAQMLLHGLPQDQNADGQHGGNHLDAVLTKEERATTQQSTADRARFAEQIDMCKKMLQHLDMTKMRHQEAVKAGHMERDACGYDKRLQHVGVQPHYERFLASPEGIAIFQSETLAAPQFDDAGNPIDSHAHSVQDNDDENEGGGDPEVLAATAGMCGRRKCKAHSNWFSTLARDVRTQIQEYSRHIAMLMDNETRIQLAAVQRSFILQHSSSEVQYVDDSDNSLTSLAGDDDGDDGGGGTDRLDEYGQSPQAMENGGTGNGNDDSRSPSQFESRSPSHYTGL